MAKNVLGNYQKVQASTASPGQRVVMVYNGIIKNLRGAIVALGRDEDPSIKFEAFHNCIQQADKLIIELQIALDMENGGEIAESLNSLYTFWKEHLSDANVEKSSKKVRDVLNMAEKLVESWIEADKKVRSSST